MMSLMKVTIKQLFGWKNFRLSYYFVIFRVCNEIQLKMTDAMANRSRKTWELDQAPLNLLHYACQIVVVPNPLWRRRNVIKLRTYYTLLLIKFYFF